MCSGPHQRIAAFRQGGDFIEGGLAQRPLVLPVEGIRKLFKERYPMALAHMGRDPCGRVATPGDSILLPALGAKWRSEQLG